MNNNVKIGLSPLNWFLSILGIIFFLLIIILPPLFRSVFKDKTVINDEKEIDVTTELVCSISNYKKENYLENVNYNFEFVNNNLKKYDKKSVRTYSDLSLFDDDKNKSIVTTTAYSLATNYASFNSSYDDLTMSININESYDLNRFTNTSFLVPGENNSTDIKSEYKLDSNINDIKNDLEANGYDCK